MNEWAKVLAISSFSTAYNNNIIIITRSSSYYTLSLIELQQQQRRRRRRRRRPEIWRRRKTSFSYFRSSLSQWMYWWSGNDSSLPSLSSTRVIFPRIKSISLFFFLFVCTVFCWPGRDETQSNHPTRRRRRRRRGGRMKRGSTNLKVQFDNELSSASPYSAAPVLYCTVRSRYILSYTTTTSRGSRGGKGWEKKKIS